MVNGQQILKIFPNLIQHVRGPLELQAEAPCSCEAPQIKALCFVSHPKWLTPCFDAEVSVIIVDAKIAKKLNTKLTSSPMEQPTPWKQSHPKLSQEQPPHSPCILSTPMLSLSMALILKEFFKAPLTPQKVNGHSIHPSAIISPTASLGEQVVIGPHAIISEGTSVGNHSYIGANSYLGPHSHIGHHSLIEPSVTLHHHVTVGNHCRIQSQSTLGSNTSNNPFYGRVILEDFVELASCVQVERGILGNTLIGEGTKIDNHCYISQSATIGAHNIFLAGVIFGGFTSIGSHCIIGGRTLIGDHLHITNKSMFNAYSFVHRNVEKSGQYMGFPLMPFSQARKAYAIFSQLPKIKKKLQPLLKK